MDDQKSAKISANIDANDTKFLEEKIITIADNIDPSIIIDIKDYYAGKLVEAQKKMVFNDSCSSCQQTEQLLREIIPPNPEEA